MTQVRKNRRIDQPPLVRQTTTQTPCNIEMKSDGADKRFKTATGRPGCPEFGRQGSWVTMWL